MAGKFLLYAYSIAGLLLPEGVVLSLMDIEFREVMHNDIKNSFYRRDSLNNWGLKFNLVFMITLAAAVMNAKDFDIEQKIKRRV